MADLWPFNQSINEYDINEDEESIDTKHAPLTLRWKALVALPIQCDTLIIASDPTLNTYLAELFPKRTPLAVGIVLESATTSMNSGGLMVESIGANTILLTNQYVKVTGAEHINIIADDLVTKLAIKQLIVLSFTKKLYISGLAACLSTKLTQTKINVSLRNLTTPANLSSFMTSLSQPPPQLPHYNDWKGLNLPFYC